MPYAFNDNKTKYPLDAELTQLAGMIAAMNNLKHKSYMLQPENPLQFTGNGVRGLLVVTGASLSRHAVYTFYSNSSGTFYAKEIVSGGVISVETANNSLTVSNTAEYGQGNAYLDIFVFSSADIG